MPRSRLDVLLSPEKNNSTLACSTLFSFILHFTKSCTMHSSVAGGTLCAFVRLTDCVAHKIRRTNKSETININFHSLSIRSSQHCLFYMHAKRNLGYGFDMQLLQTALITRNKGYYYVFVPMMQIIMSLVISIVGYAVCYRNFHHPWPTGMHVCASLFYFI